MLTHDEMVGFQAEKGALVEAEKFRDNKSFVLHLIHSKAYEVVAEKAHGKRVLDLGCNMGYGSNIMRNGGGLVTGVDVSEKAIDAARQIYGATGTDFRLIDGKKLPFADNSFDLVASFQVIEHIVAHEAYIEEIKRVLVPGGQVFFTTPNKLIRLYPDMKPWNEFHVTEYGPSEIKELLSVFFQEVEVLGLFAQEALYNAEIRRVARIRDRAKIKQDQAINSLIKGVLLFAMNLGASLQKRFTSEEDFQQKYTTADLYYKPDDLTMSLDLMAVCRNSSGG